MDDIMGITAYIILGLVFFGLPVGFTLYETAALIISARAGTAEAGKLKVTNCVIDAIVVFVAFVFEVTYISLFKSADFSGDWQTQLYNEEMHNPLYPESIPTLVLILILAVAGYYTLNIIRINDTPPLIPVLSMSAMYAGVIVIVVFTIHIFDFSDFLTTDHYLWAAPLNLILMTARVIISAVREFEVPPERMSRIEDSGILKEADRLLSNARHWPVFALILMFPLLGILVCILMLFGQAPDSLIKAFTETADYNFSQMIPPQNLYYDEHYLCTVAAGGDRGIVKPLRMGVRHGHRVIVNRQLCVANAFEQILEERNPKMHRLIRGIYDRYGFPLAGHIKSTFAADLVYILMKPSEWLFLFVIYLTDVHPEDRIAMQYTGKSLEELRREETGAYHG